MKRLILSLLALGCITLAQAQQKTTLAECNGDTVTFIRKNFEEGKARFVGKPLAELLDEWTSQLPVGYLLFGDTGIHYLPEEEQNLVNGISLNHITEQERNARSARHEPYFVLAVKLAPPYHHNVWDLIKLKRQEQNQLGPQVYNAIKDYIVTDVDYGMVNPAF